MPNAGVTTQLRKSLHNQNRKQKGRPSMVHNYQPLVQRHFLPTNNNIKEAQKMELFKGDTKRGKHFKNTTLTL